MLRCCRRYTIYCTIVLLAVLLLLLCLSPSLLSIIIIIIIVIVDNKVKLPTTATVSITSPLSRHLLFLSGSYGSLVTRLRGDNTTVHGKGGTLNGQDPLFPVGYGKECVLYRGKTCHPVPSIA